MILIWLGVLKTMSKKKYECETPPCIHVIPDYQKKKYAVFFEDDEGNVIYIESSKVKKAYEELIDLEKKRFKEAKGDEIDYIARTYLEVEPIEEYYEEE